MFQQRVRGRKDVSKTYDEQKIAILMKNKTKATLIIGTLLWRRCTYSSVRQRWQMVRALPVRQWIYYMRAFCDINTFIIIKYYVYTRLYMVIIYVYIIIQFVKFLFSLLDRPSKDLLPALYVPQRCHKN